jgi:hypothetical protein
VPPCFDDKKSFATYCSFYYASIRRANKTYESIFRNDFFYCQDCTKEYKDRMIAAGKCQRNDYDVKQGEKLLSLTEAARYIGWEWGKLRADARRKVPVVTCVKSKRETKYMQKDLDNYLRSKQDAK